MQRGTGKITKLKKNFIGYNVEYFGPNCKFCDQRCNRIGVKRSDDNGNFTCDSITGECTTCNEGYLLAKDIKYCKIDDKYFDLCNGRGFYYIPGKCDCHAGYVKAMDCQYCDIRGLGDDTDYFDFNSDGTCIGKKNHK